MHTPKYTVVLYMDLELAAIAQGLFNVAAEVCILG